MSQHHTQYGDLPLYIGGEACPSASDEWIEVTDPADQHLLARVPKATSAEIELAVRAAHDAYLLWRLKQIITLRQLDVQGELKAMKDFEVKLTNSSVPTS